MSARPKCTSEQHTRLQAVPADLTERLSTADTVFRDRLGGVVVNVFANGPKGCGFEPGQGDGITRAIKIRSTPSSRMGCKAGRSHIVRLYGM
jgi:hypothetical protein